MTQPLSFPLLQCQAFLPDSTYQRLTSSYKRYPKKKTDHPIAGGGALLGLNQLKLGNWKSTCTLKCLHQTLVMSHDQRSDFSFAGSEALTLFLSLEALRLRTSELSEKSDSKPRKNTSMM